MSDEHRLDYDDPWQPAAALIYLMTQWSQNPSPRLVPLILEHLCILEHHTSGKVAQIMRDLCRGLQDNWSVHGEPTPRVQLDSLEDIARDWSTHLH